MTSMYGKVRLSCSSQLLLQVHHVVCLCHLLLSSRVLLTSHENGRLQETGSLQENSSDMVGGVRARNGNKV